MRHLRESFIIAGFVCALFSAHIAEAAVTLTQRDYAFFNDDGYTVATGTLRTGSATSTAITNVKKGERLITRIQLDNTGTDSSTSTYRLQWENNTDAAGTWNDLGTTTQLRYTLSELGALKSRYGAVPLPDNRVTATCNGSAPTYATGTFIAMNGTTTPIGLNPGRCTEFAFAIDTSGATLGKTYRLRLVQGSTTQTLASYAQYPTLSIALSANDVLRVTKGARGYSTSTESITLEYANNVGQYTSIAIGTDGFPVISYYDVTNGDLVLFNCADIVCSSGSTTTLVSTNDIGQHTSIAIGSDGFPVVSNHGGSGSDLWIYKCDNIKCSSGTQRVLDTTANIVGYYSSVSIGADGFPAVSYFFFTNSDLKFYKCDNTACSSGTSRGIQTANSVGQYTSLAIDPDGLPVVSYYSSTGSDLKFYRCNDAGCTTGAVQTPDTTGVTGQHTSIAIGSDGFPVISYYLNASSLMFYKCANAACSSGSVSTLVTGGNVGQYTSIAIGTDGFPVISYYDVTNGDLGLYKCNNIACSTGSASTLDSTNDVGQYTSIAIGTDGFPLISYYDSTNGDLKLYHCSSYDCAPAGSSTSQLPTDTTDLPTVLGETGYSRVTSSDNVYDSLMSATSSRLAYKATASNANNTEIITATWEGQLSVATDTYLQIYDNTLGAWVGFATNTSPTANTDFTLTTTLSTNLSRYYTGGTNDVSVRVVTGTTTGPTTMKTDMLSVVTSNTILTQRDYAFFNDDGYTVATGTLRTGSATSTAITNVKKGERLITRIQLDNTGTDSSTSTYRLQWENQTDAAGTWNDLGTTTEIRYTLSELGAIRSRYGAVPLPDNRVTATCNASAPTYATGTFVAMTGTSTAFGINPARCTELAYTIDTTGATLGKTYRLRVVTASTTQVLQSYAVYPTLTIISSMNDVLRVTKGARGYTSNTEARQLSGLSNTGDYSSIAIGSDGFPVITSQFSGGGLRFYKCNDSTCLSASESALIGGGSGVYSSVAIGSDGFPVIAQYEGAARALQLYKCDNVACTSGTNRTLEDLTWGVGINPSLAIGSDGFPIISYGDDPNSDTIADDLKFYKCNDVACSSGASTTLQDITDSVGGYISMAIGSDGFPAIAHYNATSHDVLFVKCNNLSCSGISTSTAILDNGGASSVGAYISLAIGSDGFPVISYRDATALAIKLYKCDNLACSSGTARTIVDDANTYSYQTAIAIGADGYPLVFYLNETSDAVLLYKCNDVACSSGQSNMVYDLVSSALAAYLSVAIGTDGFPVLSFNNRAAPNKLWLTKCSSTDCANVASSTAQLPTDTTDLPTILGETGYSRIASSDNVYDTLVSATSSRLAYKATASNANNTEIITATWEGQLSVATDTYLQIYDNTLGAWVGFATNTSPAADTDFTLTTTLSTNLSRYYTGGTNDVSVRVVTGTTTAATILRTDVLTVSAGAAVPNQTLLHFRWRNDDGVETQATWAAAEDTAIGNGDRIFKGDRSRLRMTVSNGGTADATNITYRLDYASSSCVSWVAVPNYGTSAALEWKMDLSQWVANGTVTTDNAGLTNPGGKSFVAGQAMMETGVTTPITLTSSQFTELEYGLVSTSAAQGNLAYCFRLTNVGDTTNFTYTVQPQISLNPSQRPSYGGGAIESSTSGNQVGGQGGGSQGGGGALEGGGGAGQQGGGGGGSQGGGGGAL